MEIEANIPPINNFINKRTLKLFVKYRALQHDHPCREIVAADVTEPRSFSNRANILSNQLNIVNDACTKYDVHPIPPWEWTCPNIKTSIPHIISKASTMTHELCQNSLATLQHYTNDILIYTDGSLMNNYAAGLGVYIPKLNTEMSLPLPPSSSMDSELLAISAALTHIQNHTGSFCILTDSRCALESMKLYKPHDYAHRTFEIHRILKQCQGKVKFQWIPSHCGISGNDRADALAKQALLLRPLPHPEFSLTYIRNKAELWCKNKWLDDWKTETTGRHFYSLQDEITDLSVYKDHPRRIQSFISALKVGRLLTRALLHKIGIALSPACRHCKFYAEETIEHLFTCPSFRQIHQPPLLPFNGPAQILKAPKDWAIAYEYYDKFITL